MRRREFIALIGGATAWPLVAQAQPASRLPTVALLGDRVSVWGTWTVAFAQRLRELGWIEGRTVAFEYRWSEGRPERVAEFAAEFVQQKVDVIVTYGGAAAKLKEATTSIPIVFALAVDPLGIGLVANLSRPGGNVTGFSLQQAESASKRLELLREIVPSLRQLAIMLDSTMRRPSRKSLMFRLRRARSASMSHKRRFDGGKILHRCSMLSKVRRAPFMSWKTR